MRIYGTIKDALLAPESLIDGRSGLEKSYKRLTGGVARSIWDFNSNNETRLTGRVRKREKKKSHDSRDELFNRRLQ